MLWKLVAQRGADFVITFAVMTVGSSKTTKVGNGLKIPNEDMGGHVTSL